MKTLNLFIATILISLSCFSQNENKLSIDYLIQNLEDSENKEIIVVAHRGDWRNAPENSLQAIQYCIDMGVDMVEIDVRETKDGHLVLMHDNTIDRTTKKQGKVKDFTLKELENINLVDGLGMKTPHKIPSLEEALLLAKGNILVNIDKGYTVFEKCYKVMEQTNTLNHVIMKGKKTRAEVEKEYGQYLDKVYFMPQIKLPNPDAKAIVDDYLEKDPPIAFAFGVPQDTIQFLQYFDDIREKGSSVWVNSLWERHNGGHDDEKAALDPTVYDWYIDNNINIIQTDRPQLLLDYLRKKGLHK
ncbi:glycerophosphodiester phosphodiesterase family protein [Labilibacter sediminis]|nr:glycerophosphodiester phosphodiesterase family protein [Labilibacter sediminis]